MIVEVAKLPNAGKDFDLTFEPSELDLQSEYGKVLSQTSFAGKITYNDLRTIVKGQIKTDVELNCIRCFKAIPHNLDFSFRNAYILAEHYTKEEEAKLEELGLEISIFEGEKIDLKKVAGEQIAIVLPTQLLCEDDCKGLCEQCGKNLNVTDCKCTDEEIDPRWAALKDLKK